MKIKNLKEVPISPAELPRDHDINITDTGRLASKILAQTADDRHFVGHLQNTNSGSQCAHDPNLVRMESQDRHRGHLLIETSLPPSPATPRRTPCMRTSSRRPRAAQPQPESSSGPR